MEEKIIFDYCYFETGEGKFFLLNTEKKDDKIELINDIIYIKRKEKLCESAIKLNKDEKFNYLGQLFDIDHQDIFEKVIKYNLVEYKKDMTYLWRTLEALLNNEDITILSDKKNYKKFENPHIFKVINYKN